LIHSDRSRSDDHDKNERALIVVKHLSNCRVEFAPFLGLWQFNVRVSDCLAPSVPATPAANAASAAYAHLHNLSWANSVDSTKVIRGNANLKIES
jgi:hypothetical protein